MPDGLAEAAHQMIHGRFTDDQRNGVFKAEITVARDVSAQDKLLAYTGRHPPERVSASADQQFRRRGKVSFGCADWVVCAGREAGELELEEGDALLFVSGGTAVTHDWIDGT